MSELIRNEETNLITIAWNNGALMASIKGEESIVVRTSAHRR